jgi:diaminohydroxyphosphoribosylaminopyrimidine deaminase/5-amino-6-(5-phosphoribosylamino)uracil reductase
MAKRPYVTLKFAQTVDGKIAAGDGSSRWISSPQSRTFAHRLRARHDGILVGVRTVIADDPSLTVRRARGKHPVRVVLDRRLRIPQNAKIVKNARSIPTIIITAPGAPRKKRHALIAKGTDVIVMPGDIDLAGILRILYKKGIRRLLVEGGRRVITSFIKSKLADTITVIIAPKILGDGIPGIGSLGIGTIGKALKLKVKRRILSGCDTILITRLSPKR